MKKVSDFFYQKSSLLTATIMTIVTFGFIYFVLIDAAKCFEIADTSVKSLGTSFGYSYEMVRDFFAARTTKEIECYKELNLIWDNIFAVLYGLMYIFWVSLALKPFAYKTKFLNLLPALQVILDWLENFSLIKIANTYLSENQILASDVSLASLFTMIKWICFALIYVLLIGGIIMRIVKWIKISNQGMNRL